MFYIATYLKGRNVALIENIAEDITFILLKNQTIEIEDRDTYIYGLEIILSSLIVTGSLLTLGIILNKFLLTLIFILIFVILRSFTGGYHSQKFQSCLVISLSIYTSVLLLNYFVPVNLKDEIGIISLIACGLTIYRFAPVEHKNHPLLEEEKRKYRKISRVIISLILLFTLIGYLGIIKFIDYYFMISLTVTAITILMIIPILKGEKTNE